MLACTCIRLYMHVYAYVYYCVSVSVSMSVCCVCPLHCLNSGAVDAKAGKIVERGVQLYSITWHISNCFVGSKFAKGVINIKDYLENLHSTAELFQF